MVPSTSGPSPLSRFSAPMAQPPSGLSSSLSRHSAGIEQGQQADLDPALMQDMEAVFSGEEATVIAAIRGGRGGRGERMGHGARSRR